MIYYVEDDSSIRELVLYTLRSTGYEAKGFENSTDFFSAMNDGKTPELILLDIMLPDEDGISVLQKIKKSYSDIPVIMVTAKGTEYDKVTGLDLGADDYVSKPFGMMELMARIRAVLRRGSGNNTISDSDRYICGNVTLDDKSHIAAVNNIPAELTLKEYELLKLLMQNKGIVLTREILLERIWGYSTGETRTVDVHVKTLRQKLGAGADIIKTVRGVGYKAEENNNEN